MFLFPVRSNICFSNEIFLVRDCPLSNLPGDQMWFGCSDSIIIFCHVTKHCLSCILKNNDPFLEGRIDKSEGWRYGWSIYPCFKVNINRDVSGIPFTNSLYLWSAEVDIFTIICYLISCHTIVNCVPRYYNNWWDASFIFVKAFTNAWHWLLFTLTDPIYYLYDFIDFIAHALVPLFYSNFFLPVCWYFILVKHFVKN